MEAPQAHFTAPDTPHCRMPTIFFFREKELICVDVCDVFLHKLEFAHFSFRNFIFEIAPLYLARSLLGNGFPCAGHIVSASVEINRSHDFSKSAVLAFYYSVDHS